MSESAAPTSFRRSSPPLSVGRVLDDKFEVCGVLGEGATGIVYDARRLKENDRIALKLIHPQLTGDEQIRGRFTREAAILRRLRGKYLCPILDFGELSDPRRGAEDATLLYMVLSKIDGPSLERVLESEGVLPIARATDILREVCSALEAAHSVGIIHRDLKPANVLLSGGEHVVVVDFGMAKIVAGPGGTGTTALTQHNMVFGTPEYMAPEQARGDELDARCDVYAAGVMLYQLLTGAVPFAGSPLHVLTAHLTEEPPRVRAKAPDRGISPALEAVVVHALAKDPSERYATAAALSAAIGHALSHPDDVENVRPQPVISIDGEAADGHAATIPSPLPASAVGLGVRDVAKSVRVKGIGSQPVLPSYRPPAPSSSVTTPRSLHDAAASPPGAAASVSLWVAAAAIGIGVGVWLSLHC